MGAADTPRNFDIMVKGSLRIVGNENPDLAYNDEGKQCSKAHPDDIRWVCNKPGLLGKQKCDRLQKSAWKC